MNRIGWLLPAWVAPALIAGALGWPGIWGTGSAFIEYMIPVPVAGGFLHVPGFAVLAAFVISFDRLPLSVQRIAPAVAVGIFLCAMALQADTERLANWLTTDYQPYGSPLRFGSNPVLLFLATDAFFAALFAFSQGMRSPKAIWAAAIVAPFAVAGLSVFQIAGEGLRFEIGGPHSEDRSRELWLVYVSGPYDEDAFKAWYAGVDHLASPWHSPNYEQSAIYFTNSLELAKSRRLDGLTPDTVVATACQYESDLSMYWHEGKFDCFADRPTVESRLAAFSDSLPPDFDRKAARWLGIWDICREWVPRDDIERWMTIRRETECERFWSRGLREGEELADRLGPGTEEFDRITAALRAIESDSRGAER